jgi:hypothetical protein
MKNTDKIKNLARTISSTQQLAKKAVGRGAAKTIQPISNLNIVVELTDLEQIGDLLDQNEHQSLVFSNTFVIDLLERVTSMNVAQEEELTQVQYESHYWQQAFHMSIQCQPSPRTVTSWQLQNDQQQYLDNGVELREMIVNNDVSTTQLAKLLYLANITNIHDI